MDFPRIALPFLLLLGFLLILGLLAYLAVRSLRGSSEKGGGGFVHGCAVALGLGFLFVLGMIGVGFFLFTAGVRHLERSEYGERATWAEESSTPDGRLHLRFRVRGPIGDQLHDLVANRTGEAHPTLWIDRESGSDEATWEFAVPLEGRDAGALAQALRAGLSDPAFVLPEGVSVRLEAVLSDA
jgi:hypothetical protein